jgi:pimeloyl-ACP methyl ester carboxylesterase
MKASARAIAVGVALWALTAVAASAEVVNLPTRPGVTQRMLVDQPENAPSAVLVLMTGGAGRLGIFDNGSLRNDGNFLVRSRSLFVQHGYAVVLPDTPSDRSSPPFLGGAFRESPEHAADLAAVIAWARQRFSRPVWIVGTSRGTHSAALAALSDAGPGAPDGVVLTSTILSSSRFGQSEARPVPEMPLEKVRMPVLVAHHEQDQCQVCPPALLPRLMDKLKSTTSKLLTYQGGQSSGPPCEAFAHHGFNGIEGKVVDDIAAWVASQSPPMSPR